MFTRLHEDIRQPREARWLLAGKDQGHGHRMRRNTFAVCFRLEYSDGVVAKAGHRSLALTARPTSPRNKSLYISFVCPLFSYLYCLSFLCCFFIGWWSRLGRFLLLLLCPPGSDPSFILLLFRWPFRQPLSYPCIAACLFFCKSSQYPFLPWNPASVPLVKRFTPNS